jgi:hypothetical protein
MVGTTLPLPFVYPPWRSLFLPGHEILTVYFGFFYSGFGVDFWFATSKKARIELILPRVIPYACGLHFGCNN